MISQHLTFVLDYRKANLRAGKEFTKFMENALNGYVLDLNEYLEDEIELWHEIDTDISLPDWLGMTESEYDYILEKPGNISLIIALNNNKQLVRNIVKEWNSHEND
jgi:hypothetical protein